VAEENGLDTNTPSTLRTSLEGALLFQILFLGEVAKWSIALVLKTSIVNNNNNK
jgi:hypothetical protein